MIFRYGEFYYEVLENISDEEIQAIQYKIQQMHYLNCIPI
jgi:hypothetical protein